MENQEENKPYNPKAFPNDYNSEDGMSLRDYFAAKAMQSLIASDKIGHKIESFANESYKFADAMLKQREL